MVRNLCFHKHEDILTKNDKALIGLCLKQSCYQVKRSSCVTDVTHYFRRLTSYDGTTNLMHPYTWTHWIVDQCTISLMHVDTNAHAIKTNVPNLVDIDERVMKETLKDVNELIKYALTKIPFKKFIATEACKGVESLDAPLYKCNFMFYLSLCMVFQNYFACKKIKKLFNEIECDPLLIKRGMFDMICSTVVCSSPDNANESMETKIKISRCPIYLINIAMKWKLKLVVTRW